MGKQIDWRSKTNRLSPCPFKILRLRKHLDISAFKKGISWNGGLKTLWHWMVWECGSREVCIYDMLFFILDDPRSRLKQQQKLKWNLLEWIWTRYTLYMHFYRNLRSTLVAYIRTIWSSISKKTKNIYIDVPIHKASQQFEALPQSPRLRWKTTKSWNESSHQIPAGRTKNCTSSTVPHK